MANEVFHVKPDVRREPPFRPTTKERLLYLERQVELMDDMLGFAMKHIAVEIPAQSSILDINARPERMSLLDAYARSIAAKGQPESEAVAQSPDPAA